jgi:hypothetical protein
LLLKEMMSNKGVLGSVSFALTMFGGAAKDASFQRDIRGMTGHWGVTEVDVRTELGNEVGSKVDTGGLA